MSTEPKSYFRSLFFGLLLAKALTLTTALAVASKPLHADFVTNFGSGANQFTMSFVPIGNPGNAASTAGVPKPVGSVGYHYNMGKFEVSRDMVNKANASGRLDITLEDMASLGGNGSDRPATGVSWNEAARFVNWLNTSQGYSVAYKFGSRPGDLGYNPNENIQLWLPGDMGYNPANLFRNSHARYFLPSVDEWYKAAYYDPSKSGGAGGYWKFPTGSDSVPTAVSEGTADGTAVYGHTWNQGPADVTNSGGLSRYGVMGMGGNVLEWEETERDLVNDSPSSSRSSRGGDWNFDVNFLSPSYRFAIEPTYENPRVGFRVASVPEPSSVVVLLMLTTAGFCQRRRKLTRA
jgi:hypothetical protein